MISDPLPEKGGLSVTFNVTEECNMRCKYCYEINKQKKSLDFGKAKRFIDILLSDEDYLCLADDEDNRDFWQRGLIIDFIGGDALMNVDLCDQILTYFLFKLNTTRTKRAMFWRGAWRALICSNGTLFGNKRVRDFLLKWKDALCLGVSVDGCPEIHDKNRIMAYTGKNGEEVGSIGKILEWWPWYRENFPYDSLHTKSTLSRDSIPYLYDSLVFMHETLGIRYISQNFIMEDTGCTEEDYGILREQMQKCIDYVYDHRDRLYWSMIDRQFAMPNKNRKMNKNFCGSGLMPSLSIDGEMYPCFRWLPHTQHGRGVMSVGNVDDGFIRKENFRRVRDGQEECKIARPECLGCEHEPVCPYCVGGCYAEYGGFIRTTHICELIKIQCEYARRYWERLEANK